jgi:hypothetical protein
LGWVGLSVAARAREGEEDRVGGRKKKKKKEKKTGGKGRKWKGREGKGRRRREGGEGKEEKEEKEEKEGMEGRMEGMEETYVDSCLDAWYGAGALEHDVKPICELIELGMGENAVGGGPCTVHFVLERELAGWGGGSGWSSRGGFGGRVEDGIDKAVAFGEIEAGLVDVDADDARGALGTGEGAREEAHGAGAEDEDGVGAGEGGAAGGVEDDGEGLGERRLVVGDGLGERVEPRGRVVDQRLERAVEVRRRFRRGAETHRRAEVVPALAAACARRWTVLGIGGGGGGSGGAGGAGQAALDRDAGADLELGGRVGGDCGDDAGRFMA